MPARFLRDRGGNMQRMETLARLRNAPRTVAKAQRRLWLIQILTWPTLVLSGVTVLAAVAVHWHGVRTAATVLEAWQGSARMAAAEQP